MQTASDLSIIAGRDQSKINSGIGIKSWIAEPADGFVLCKAQARGGGLRGAEVTEVKETRYGVTNCISN